MAHITNQKQQSNLSNFYRFNNHEPQVAAPGVFIWGTYGLGTEVPSGVDPGAKPR